MKSIRITMVHDLTCSWCPIGYNNLKQALRELKGSVEAEIRFLPYEINPGMKQGGETIANVLSGRFNWSRSDLKAYQDNLVRVGKAAGVHFDFSRRTHYYNTRMAHLFMHWAESRNLQCSLNEAMLEAYFSTGRPLDNRQVLLAIAESAGCDRNQLLAELDAPATQKAFEEKRQLVSRINTQKNIRSVPAFIFNDKTVFSGSGPVKDLKRSVQAGNG